MYADEPLGFKLSHPAYAFEAATIDLCLSLFPWAPSMRSKAAVRVYTRLDLRGSISACIRISTGKTRERRVLDELPIERGAFSIRTRPPSTMRGSTIDCISRRHSS